MNTRPRPLNRKKLYGLLVIVVVLIASMFVYFGGSDAPVEEKEKTASELLAEYEVNKTREMAKTDPSKLHSVRLLRIYFSNFLWDMSYVCSFMQDGKIPLHDCSPEEPLLVDIAPHCPAIIAYRETPRKPFDPNFQNEVPDYVALLPLIDEIEAVCGKITSYRDHLFGCFTGTLLGKPGTHYISISAYAPCQGLDDIEPYIERIRAELKERSNQPDQGVSAHAK